MQLLYTAYTLFVIFILYSYIKYFKNKLTLKNETLQLITIIILSVSIGILNNFKSGLIYFIILYLLPIIKYIIYFLNNNFEKYKVSILYITLQFFALFFSILEISKFDMSHIPFEILQIIIFIPLLGIVFAEYKIRAINELPLKNSIWKNLIFLLFTSLEIIPQTIVTYVAYARIERQSSSNLNTPMSLNTFLSISFCIYLFYLIKQFLEFKKNTSNSN